MKNILGSLVAGDAVKLIIAALYLHHRHPAIGYL